MKKKDQGMSIDDLIGHAMARHDQKKAKFSKAELNESAATVWARAEYVMKEDQATNIGSFRIPSIRMSWEAIREKLAWLTIPLDSLPVQTAGGFSRDPGVTVAKDSLSVDQIFEQAPDGLQWVPARTNVPTPGQIELTFVWPGNSEIVAPSAIDVRRNGELLEATKVEFDPHVGSFKILLAGFDVAPKTIAIAQQEDGTLTLNLSNYD